MNEKEFVALCKKKVMEYVNARLNLGEYFNLTEDSVYVVWLCKTLQNNKALVSTTMQDGMYYELTYNGDRKELYFDAYKKIDNMCIRMEENV